MVGCVAFVVRSPNPRGLVTRREHPWMFRAVSAEASGCSRPRHHGGIPGSRWRRRRHPKRGELRVARGAERPSSAVATTRREARLAQDRAAARRSLLASPRRQGGWSGFVSQMTPSTWGWMAHEARTASQPHRCRPPLWLGRPASPYTLGPPLRIQDFSLCPHS